MEEAVRAAYACGDELAEVFGKRRLSTCAEPLLSIGGKMARTIVVVSVAHGFDCHGMTADSFTIVSESPPLVLVAIGIGGRTHRLVESATGFAVSALAGEQADVATHFASRRRPHGVRQFDAVDWEPAPFSGAPVLTDALWWLDCGDHTVTSAGDHVVVIGKVIKGGARARSGLPLVRFDGEYQLLGKRLVAEDARDQHCTACS